MKIEEIEKIIGYTFVEKQLLRTAFTHSSYSNEKNSSSNETYEFLGDSLLGFVVAESLLGVDAHEGTLTTMRAEVVNTSVLAQRLEELTLDKHIMFGQGEINKDHTGKKVHADTFEALCAAVFLDGGFDVARNVVKILLGDVILLSAQGVLSSNYKGMLQEYVQENKMGNINYICENREKQANDNFIVKVYVGGNEFGYGAGKQIKIAEQMASKDALSKINI